MQPEPEDEYFLGGGGGGDPAQDRRLRRGALIGLAAVLVLVAVAITLTSLFVDTSPAVDGPRTAVRKWSETLTHGDTAARRRLECAAPTDLADALTRLLAGTRYRVSTGRAHRQDTKRWVVPLRVDGPDGSPVTSVSVSVVRESGRYVVC